MSAITWLHLSDLHFRKGEQDTWNEDIVLRALLTDLRERIRSDGLHPDFIVVTGDLAFGGAEEEYVLARQFLDQLIEMTGLEKSRLFVVPGNHDVARTLVTRGAKGIASSLDSRDSINEVLRADEDRSLLLRRFEQYGEFVSDYFAGDCEFDDEHYFHVHRLTVGGKQMALLGLNSAWLCASDEDKDHLALGERQVREAIDLAKESDLKIALMHHPFDWLLECDRNDCEPLLMQACDFVLHGHLHRTGLLSLATPDATAMVIAAGASYETREHANGYNLMQLDLDKGQGVVHLRRYSDERGGFWTKDVTTYRNVNDGRYEFTLLGVAAPEPEESPTGESQADSASVTGSGSIAQGPGATAAGAGPPDLRRTTERYLSHIVDRYRYLDFRGMGVSDRVPLRMPLTEMYVPLKARIELPEGETWDRGLRLAGREIHEEEALGRGLGKPVALSGLLKDSDGLIILGDPGAGKTTFLKYLALRLANGQGEQLGLGERLPVLLPLSAYATALAEKDIPLDKFICEYYRSRGVDLPTQPMMAQALTHGNVLLLLDGLDEVKDPSQRRLVVERVVDFFTVQRKRGSKFVVTSRIVGYREVRPVVEGLTECTLVDLEDEEIEQFVAKWTAAVERAARGDSPAASRDAQQEREELLDAVRRNPGVRRMASNPLLLTILALMKRQGVTLPERRVELYENYVHILLKHWNLARGLDGRTGPDLDVVETVRVLAPLALWMHETSPGLGLAKREDMRRKLEEIYAARSASDPEQAARQLLADVRDHTGLLLERGPGEYGFIHLTFQEYLAAVAVAQKGQADLTPVVDVLRSHVGDDNWHEVTLLTIGYIGLVQQRDEAASAVLEGLVEAAPGEPGEALALAGEAAVDVWPGGVTAQCRTALGEQLTESMTADSRVQAPSRAACGRTLAKLGDPRPETTTIEGMQFCYVPPGPFCMGEDKEAHLNKTLNKPYWIGRFPVTNAQFHEFVKAGGYGESHYWTVAEQAGFWNDGGFQVRPEQHPYKDALSREHLRTLADESPRQSPHAPGEPYDLANHPVVDITWYECLAFGGWLTDRLRDEGRLPEGWKVQVASEAEWEKAARGGKGIPAEPVMTDIANAGQQIFASQQAVIRIENPGAQRAYPWGNSADIDGPDVNRANYYDTGINTTSAVGCFPAGASPYGCEEMSGNVWEWTRSLYDDDPYPQDGKARKEREDADASPDRLRVLRGGSFLYTVPLTRCAFRYRYSPYYRYYYIGFRLCVCPHF